MNLQPFKRIVDGQDAAWMPPWPTGGDDRERAVRQLRVIALRLRREQDKLGPWGRVARTLAWPALLPLKAWQGAAWASSAGRVREWRRSLAELAIHNIRAGILAYARAFGLEANRLARLHISDQENQALLGALQGTHPAFAIGHKRFFAAFCRDHRLATVPLVGEGRGDRVAAAVPVPPGGDLFFKPADEYGGRGACHLRATGPGQWTTRAGEQMAWADLGAWAGRRTRDGEWVLQPALQPDPRWSQWSAGALGTVRLVTMGASAGAEPQVLAAVLRLPRAGAEVDNYSQGGWLANIRPDTGVAEKAFGHSPRLISPRHPDTGAMVEGLVVPGWDELVALARRAHVATNGLSFVGWDVTLQPEGPVLVEANPVWNLWPTLFLGELDYLDVMREHFLAGGKRL